ncbi:MAG TPA: DUF11 domain-containing protein [Thermoanaerobaculia bacterium]|nr:DUF11 domain-containing protein [Thermoanaerobaculia bacterium]
MLICMRRACFTVVIMLNASIASGLFAATRVWTGAASDGLWSTAANWDSGVPQIGDDVVLFGTSTNDIPSIALHSMRLNAGTTVGGQRIFLGAGGITAGTISSGATNTVNGPITLTANQTWTLPATLNPGMHTYLNGDIDLNGFSLALFQSGSLNISGSTHIAGTVHGTGSLTFSSSSTASSDVTGHLDVNGPVTLSPRGFLTLSGANHFSGLLSITGGFVVMAANDALPPNVAIHVQSSSQGGILSIGPHAVVASSLSGNGVLDLNGGSFSLSGPGTSTFTGALRGQGQFALTDGTLVFVSGLVSSIAGAITVSGAALDITPEFYRLDATPVAATTVSGGGLIRLRPLTLGVVHITDGVFEPLRTSNTPVITGLTLTSQSTFRLPVAGAPSPAALEVRGAIDLGGSQFEFSPPDSWVPGTAFTIISNGGSSPVSGTFAGYPEGATFVAGTATYQITYAGGNTGRDVVATLITAGTNVIEADLAIAGSGPSAGDAGNQFDHTLTVTNLGPGMAEDLELHIEAAVGSTILDAHGAGWSCTHTASTAHCTLPQLAPGAAPPVTVSLHTSISADTATTIATIASSTTDPVASNDTASTGTALVASDLSVSLTASPSPVAAGGEVTFTASVFNAGHSPAGPVTFESVIPSDATLVEVMAESWACSTTTGSAVTLSCTLDELAADETQSLAFRVTAPATGSLSIRGTVWSSHTDPVSANNSAIAVVATCDAPEILTQPRSVNAHAGSTVTFTITTRGSIQWYEGPSYANSQPVPGATGTTLQVVATRSTAYWALVSNPCGSAMSDIARLHVTGRRRSARP